MIRPLAPAHSVPRKLQSLGNDCSGAIMTMGVFFAVFTLGMIWYMMGLGDAIHYRERMQDAADSGALAGAILHARGMNTIVLINWLMAAVLSVLVTLRLIVSLIIVAELALLIASIFGGGAASLIPVLEQQRQTVNNITDEVEPVIHNVLAALHQVGEVIRLIVPIGANLRVIGIVAGGFQPEVNDVLGGVAIPPRLTLPVEDDDFSVLCRKAGEFAGHLAILPLTPILPGFAEDAAREALGALAGAASGWFCGQPGASPPSYTTEDSDQGRPMLPIVRQCAELGDNDASNVDEVTELCRQAEREENASMPDPSSGACRLDDDICVPIQEEDGSTFPFDEDSWCAGEGAGQTLTSADCALDDTSAYGRRLLEARSQCAPENGQTKRGYFYSIQEVTIIRTRATTNAAWESGEPELGTVQARNYTDADDDSSQYRSVPCGAEPGDPWNTTDLDQPVCTTEPTEEMIGPNTMRVHYWQVTQVYGCRQRVRGQTVTVDDLDLSPGGGGEGGEYGGEGELGGLEAEGGGQRNENPFRFQEGLLLGTSDLQIRSLVLGDNPSRVGAAGNADGAVALTRGNYRDNTGSTAFLQVARLWGRFSVAQAEYFYGGDEDRGEWMWNMKWTARLRRFRLNRDGDGGESADGGSTGGDPPDVDSLFEGFQIPGADQLQVGQANCGGNAACDEASGFMSRFDELFLH